MRQEHRSFRSACYGAAIALLACAPSATEPAANEDEVMSFTLVSLDANALPARINNGLYVSAGRLRFFRNGVFAEGLTHTFGTRTPSGVQESGGMREDPTTGVWLTLPDGRLELRYSDRRPFVYDTATAIDGSLIARCSAYSWCGPARATVWRGSGQ